VQAPPEQPRRSPRRPPRSARSTRDQPPAAPVNVRSASPLASGPAAARPRRLRVPRPGSPVPPGPIRTRRGREVLNPYARSQDFA
jgi:hypothetical protein